MSTGRKRDKGCDRLRKSEQNRQTRGEQGKKKREKKKKKGRNHYWLVVAGTFHTMMQQIHLEQYYYCVL